MTSSQQSSPRKLGLPQEKCMRRLTLPVTNSSSSEESFNSIVALNDLTRNEEISNSNNKEEIRTNVGFKKKNLSASEIVNEERRRMEDIKLKRSISSSNLSSIVTESINDTTFSHNHHVSGIGRRLKLSLSRLHAAQHHYSIDDDEDTTNARSQHHFFPHIHIPTITFTAPVHENDARYKFYFPIRRLSQMVSLSLKLSTSFRNRIEIQTSTIFANFCFCFFPLNSNENCGTRFSLTLRYWFFNG